MLGEDVEASIRSMTDREKAGVIQHFEMLVELSWKVLKDYLENEGHRKIHSGKQVIRQAFQDEIIEDPEVWMESLRRRNETSHIYNQEIMEGSLDFIEGSFYPLVRALYLKLKKEL